VALDEAAQLGRIDRRLDEDDVGQRGVVRHGSGGFYPGDSRPAVRTLARAQLSLELAGGERIARDDRDFERGQRARGLHVPGREQG